MIRDYLHKPVLKEEVLEYLNPKIGGIYVDATYGTGGHSKEIVKRIGERGKIYGIEQDENLIKIVGREKNIHLIIGNYIYMEKYARENNFGKVNGVLFDFGLNSYQIEKSGRGFSFLRDEGLDMRFNTQNKLTAEEIINSYPENEIADILYKFGGEKYSRRIAKAICEERKKSRIISTATLANIIKNTLRVNNKKVNPATRTFQALRITVNNEIENIKLGLEAACRLIEKGGRVVAISFHSLEHKLVRQTLKNMSYVEGGKIITNKAVKPKREEIINNQRSRSAILRAWQKI